jgi:hypothetical protein
MEWSVALCRKDSDNDGLTNGDELGDGCCDGSGANAHLISHPGLGDGDCGALPCRSDKPSCGASSLPHDIIDSLKRSMVVSTSRDSTHSPAAHAHPVIMSWAPPPTSVCACSFVIRAGTLRASQLPVTQHELTPANGQVSATGQSSQLPVRAHQTSRSTRGDGEQRVSCCATRMAATCSARTCA